MYSYREFLDQQRKSFMTDDEKLERKNLETLRFYISEINRQESHVVNTDETENDVKIYESKEK